VGAILDRMTDSSQLEPLYLICGSDTPKVRRAVARLRRRVHDETASDLNIFVYDGRAVRAGVVLDEAQTPTFALGTRLLLVLEADRWPAADRDRLADYLADPAPDTCVALVGETFKKTERLSKLAEKRKAVLRYELPRRFELPDWARERAQARRLRLGRAEAQHLVDRVGSDPDTIESEIEKLAVYSPGGQVGVDDIDEVCVQSLEASIFQLMDAVGRRDARSAFRSLEILYSRGEDHFSVFFMLLRHVRQLRTLTDLPSGVPSGEAARILGVAPFRAQKLVEQRGNFSRRELGRALVALADAEGRMKGKAQYEPKLALEMALARLISGE
jgi:DNA polymerase-3 subunit delta